LFIGLKDYGEQEKTIKHGPSGQPCVILSRRDNLWVANPIVNVYLRYSVTFYAVMQGKRIGFLGPKVEGIYVFSPLLHLFRLSGKRWRTGQGFII
jgi:hypothetical protein